MPSDAVANGAIVADNDSVLRVLPNRFVNVADGS